ncbi:flagellar hook-associated protein FlgK [Sphingomonas sp. RHCKR7]|uniref:flagellar hook-associated protein FlgK n=1 Tax=Sphingomonas folli TaxID=2862497 RepID=UPI001CA4F0A5|nr:flagellar hook-associated protein FlgK [Sphingomonas folli]MBW6525537.1 flagellar hook-associated protein FlgK [Sphingomonas folli]
MSINSILDAAVSGLHASQTALRTTSQNIANANTPGYARQRHNQEATRWNVEVQEPTRIADRFLERAVYARSGEAERASITASYLDRIQNLFGTPGSESNLAARVSALLASATKLTGGSDPTLAAAGFVAQAQDTLRDVQDVSKQVRGIRGEIDVDIRNTVDRINPLLRQIDSLNQDIVRLTALHLNVSGPADQRAVAVQELSGLIAVNAREQKDGRVAIETAKGIPLLDQQVRQLDYRGGVGDEQGSAADIAVRFINRDGSMGALTGDTLGGAWVGGKLGGLLQLRDEQVSRIEHNITDMFAALAESLNGASNAATSYPAPRRLDGRPTGLVADDSLNFSGVATVAVVSAAGVLVAKAKLDFAALGANATIDDAVASINSQLKGKGTASFTNGRLTIQATSDNNGIAVAQDETSPARRAGLGFSQFFGLNDMVRSDAPIAPIGLVPSDPHGMTAGQKADLVVRDATGQALARYTMTGSGGGSVRDLLIELNASPLAAHGSFALDSRGRVRFTAANSSEGATIDVAGDTSDRLGTGVSFSQWSGLARGASGLRGADVSAEMASNSKRVPLSRLDPTVAVGARALTPSDPTSAAVFVDRLGAKLDLGRFNPASLYGVTTDAINEIGNRAAVASGARTAADDRLSDAVARRDNFSGVNVDEEMSQLIVLQNSYAASARVISAVNNLYDSLLSIVR